MNRIGLEPDPAKRLRRNWGAAIRQHRQALGMTQRDLQRKLEELGLNVTVSAISMWETGGNTPRAYHQACIAKALNTPHARLFAMTDEDAA